MAVGLYGTIFTSPDGTTWTKKSSGIHSDLYAVAYGNNQFVAIGVKDLVLTSSDGTTWIKRSSGTNAMVESVTYGNGMFVAVGAEGTILTSCDGITWTKKSSGTTHGISFVTYEDDLFIAPVGGDTFLVSPDGTTWTAKSSGIIGSFYSITYGNNRFVAVGSSIAVSMADNLGTITNVPDNGIPQFTISAANRRISAPVSYQNPLNSFRIGLFSLTGKCVHAFCVPARNGIASIPIGEFPRGTYIVKIDGGSGVHASSRIVLAD